MRDDNGSTRPARAGMAVAARGVAATIGGYAMAAAGCALAARILPLPRVEATLWAMLAAFPVYAALALWAFHARSLVRVTAVVWGGAVACSGALFLLGVRS
ncbi:iron transporter [Sphingomonas sp. 22176]|uniref:iron transporter n=1 Tax=Sphingomonas sp. 22176 TaxID=3453884 RepID=UPI003F8387A4